MGIHIGPVADELSAEYWQRHNRCPRYQVRLLPLHFLFYIETSLLAHSLFTPSFLRLLIDIPSTKTLLLRRDKLVIENAKPQI